LTLAAVPVALIMRLLIEPFVMHVLVNEKVLLWSEKT